MALYSTSAGLSTRRVRKNYLRRPKDVGLRVYAACFCEERDLLSQWRAYSGGVTGYAIEFSWAKLRQQFPINRLGRVEYEINQQREILSQILFTLIGHEARETDFAKVAAGLANSMLTVRAFLKSPTFRE